MAIAFRSVTHPPLKDFTAWAPDGSIIGIIGLKGSGKASLLRLAAGVDQPSAGSVECNGTRRLICCGEPLDFSGVNMLALDAALACQDPLVREQGCIEIERLRRSGTAVLMASHDQALLSRLVDEIWWLHEGKLAAKGHSSDIFPKYNQFLADRLTEWGRTIPAPLDLSSRRGDAGAEILLLETFGGDGSRSIVLRSHAPASIRVTLRFSQTVENPVIGIMIRTRIGLEVYGTNTELERIAIGPCSAEQTLTVQFGFICELCPGDYTLTAACHDPDGTAHDWLDDAVAFSVADDRYTAGVANLRATVSVTKE